MPKMICRGGRLRSGLLALALSALAPLAAPSLHAAELVMLETRYCPECAKFKKDVGPSYATSKAGRLLPLRSLDIDNDKMDVALTGPAVMTPTFVFVEHGIEIARFTGYPGPDRFYRILNRVADRLIALGHPEPKN